MKKLLYTLIALLKLYVCFYCIRIYKGRTDSELVSRLVAVRTALLEKTDKINNIHNYYEREMSAINNKKTKQSKDSDIDALEADSKYYNDLNLQTQKALVTLKTKTKELDSYITKCNIGSISRNLRKETNKYLTKYIDKEGELDTIVKNIEEQFNNSKDKKKAKENAAQKDEQPKKHIEKQTQSEGEGIKV